MPERHPSERTIAYVGCRTTRERHARGTGIGVFAVGRRRGEPWQRLQEVPLVPNPSFLAFDRSRRFLLAVHGDGSDVSTLRIDAGSGRVETVGTWPTGGRNPVHLALDPSNRCLVVANHVTSTVAVLPFDADTGHIGEPTDLRPLEGAVGPHRVEQPFSKPHQVEFDPSGRFLLVPDKGLDRVFVFRLDAERGMLQPVDDALVSVRQGAGPRHLAITADGRYGFILNELDSTLVACRFDARTGGLAPFQVLPSLPDTVVTDSRAAEIAISRDGRFLYASNRGADNIGAFAIDGVSGRLSPIGWAQSGGRTPRFFCIDPSGEVLFSLNEDSDSIVALAIDPQDGTLRTLGPVAETGSPTCLLLHSFIR